MADKCTCIDVKMITIATDPTWSLSLGSLKINKPGTRGQPSIGIQEHYADSWVSQREYDAK